MRVRCSKCGGFAKDIDHDTCPPLNRKIVPLEERFWRQVEIRSLNECWPWTGFTSEKGYGSFTINPGELDIPVNSRRRTRYAHRIAFFLMHGRWPVPKGLHGCDNPGCCNAKNPEHIHEGTQKQNLTEMVERSRSNKGARHWNVKLTSDQITAIKDDPRSGTQIAPEYGVQPRHINRIKKGDRW